MSFRRGQMATEVLRDVNLRIERGEFVSLIGHSGCGKSTLLNILGGLLKSTSGEVLPRRHREVDEPGPDRAIVFQNHSLLPWLTVYGNIAIAVDKVFGGQEEQGRAPRLGHAQSRAGADGAWPRTSAPARSRAA
jgi:nitrate/nitrite transport system ATP-binding protein